MGSQVVVKIYNTVGAEIRTLMNAPFAAGVLGWQRCPWRLGGKWHLPLSIARQPFDKLRADRLETGFFTGEADGVITLTDFIAAVFRLVSKNKFHHDE